MPDRAATDERAAAAFEDPRALPNWLCGPVYDVHQDVWASAPPWALEQVVVTVIATLKANRYSLLDTSSLDGDPVADLRAAARVVKYRGPYDGWPRVVKGLEALAASLEASER